MSPILTDKRIALIFIPLFLCVFCSSSFAAFGFKKERSVVVAPVQQNTMQSDEVAEVGEKAQGNIPDDPSPSPYMKVSQPGGQAVFVQEFLQKKNNFDEVIRKQQLYTKMLEDLKQEQQGIDEVVRQEKRGIVQRQLSEINKKLNETRSY